MKHNLQEIKNKRSSTIPDLLEELRQEHHFKGLFIGAGFSKSANLPDWNGLLMKLLEESTVDKALNKEITELIETNQYTMAAYLLKLYTVAKLPEKSMREKEKVFSENISKMLRSSNELPENIAKPFVGFCNTYDIRLIVTTNFDCLLENTFKKYINDYEWKVFTHDHCADVRRALKEGEKVIFKIHGDIDSPKTIVFSQDNYQKLYFGKRNFPYFLARLLDTRTFLFLGFSLTDPFFATSLDTLAAYFGIGKPSHYAIIPKTIKAEWQAWEDLRGIKTIPYLKSEEGGHENALISIFKEISKAEPTDIYEFKLDSVEEWGNLGANPELVKDDGRTVVKLHHTYDNGKKTNCSIHSRIGDVKGGSTVKAKVQFKCKSTEFGMMFIGDSGGSDPYDNSETEKLEGTGKWEELVVEVKYDHDDICMVFLYGNRDNGKEGDYVLYKDLKIEILNP